MHTRLDDQGKAIILIVVTDFKRQNSRVLAAIEKSGKEKREARWARWLFLLALLPLDFGPAFLQFQQYGEGIRVRVDAEIPEAAIFADFKQQVLFVLMRPRPLACRARII
jgi:hypothetical protein